MTAQRHDALDFQPVIIVGAARSGTNMLRDALTQLAGLATWPCDEINYIWRHYHATYPTDELTAAHATAKVRRYVRGAFKRLARRTGARWIVEKTCASSLRVDFVHAILPEAKFNFLVRDGRDAAASAVKRWHSKLELRYTLRKARFVPLTDVPYYGWRFLRHRAHRLISREHRLASWGPRFAGIDAMLNRTALPEVCAEQWRVCVERAADSFARVAPSRVHRVLYEDFVYRPTDEFINVLRFLNVPIARQDLSTLLSDISSSSVGNWQKQFDAQAAAAVNYRLSRTLMKFGYHDAEWATTQPRMKRAA
jgi:hypothetical protein